MLLTQPSYSATTPEIYLTSSTDSNKTTVTAWVKNIPSISATFAYQVTLYFNTSLLNCVEAWIPRLQKTWIFAGLITVSPVPTVNNTIGLILVGDVIFDGNAVSGCGPFSLAMFKFQLKNELDDPLTYLSIDNPDTYLLNDELKRTSAIVLTHSYLDSVGSSLSLNTNTSTDSPYIHLDEHFNTQTDLLNSLRSRNTVTIELIVGINDKAPNSYAGVKALIEERGGKIIDKVSVKGKIIASVVNVAWQNVHLFKSDIEASGFSTYIEPNYKFKVWSVPNDPYWQDQWGPKKMQADWAWNTTKGDPSVVIAVVDTGVDWHHPDLAANIWNNTDEIIDGIDNDDNGYVDDVRGWDFVDTTSPVWPGEDGTVRDNDPMDFHGHGTHCSGIVAAVGNNSEGIAGMSWNSKIMPVRAGYKAPNGFGYLEYDDAAEAIIYAADNDANIISLSWGTDLYSGLFNRVVEYAYDEGVLLVAAAGNDGWSVKSYPAAYEEVVAVAATDENDNLTSFSNYGQWIELSAPGVNIISTLPNNSYDSWSGTSMATPHVSGLVALIWSQYPNMTKDEVRYQLRLTADDLGAIGFDENYGWGRVNAKNATEESQPQHDLAILSWLEPSYALPGQAVGMNTTVLNFGLSDEFNVTMELIANGTTVDNDQVSIFSSGIIFAFNTTWTPSSQGVYNITTYLVAVYGETRTENNVASTFVTVRNPTILYVPQNYTTIQSAIDAAMPLDIIHVSNGTYNERLAVNKPLISIVGENKDTTVIDGGKAGVVVYISEEGITITGFTIQNSSSYGTLVSLTWSKGNNITDNIIRKGYEGILSIYDRGDNQISRNTIMETIYGISIAGGEGNKIHENHVIAKSGAWNGIEVFGGYNVEIINNKVAYYRYGIVLFLYAVGVRIEGNFIKANRGGLWLNNVIDHAIYRNTFTQNIKQANVLSSEDIRWSGRWNVTGNYWSDYTGNNTDGDRYGIGDTPYVIDENNKDNFPLMNPYLPGDITHDGKVDMRDIAIVAKAYGSGPGDSEWNPHADLNEDAIIDDSDLDIVVPNFGKAWQDYWGE
jgi:subtilisin family serine protease/nitrous oxidase accessory protein NosD